MNNLQKMKLAEYQQGMGMFNLIFLLLLISFAGIFAFKVVPLYADNRYVVVGLKELIDSGAPLVQMSDAEIKKKMNNFYLLNNIRTDGPKNIVIKRQSDRVIVQVDYEERVSFIYNVDLVVNFKNHLDSAHLNDCCKPLDEK